MSDTFKYKITGWDASNQTLVITLEDGGWANITIMKPYPKNLQDLDKIVRAYSVPKEVIEARTGVDSDDLMWLANSVGIEREAERFSFFRAQGLHKTQELTSMDPPTDPIGDLIARVEALEAQATKKKTE